MKVLQLDSGLEWRGGQQQLFQLVRGLSKVGIEQQLVLREHGALAGRAAELQLSSFSLPLRSEIDLASVLELRQIIKRFRPDIVHAHDARTLGLMLAVQSLGLSTKVIAARRVAFPLKRNPFTWLKYRKVPSRIIAVSRFVRDVLLAAGVDSRRVEVVYDGFDWQSTRKDLSREQARQQLGVSDDVYLIGCVGQFTAEKGHSILIRGFEKVSAAFPNARLVLVGDGPLKASYLKQIERAGLKGRVILPGFVSELENVWPALDLFVFPSLQEGLGSSLLMAMARGVPVCASRTGGIPEVVAHGETGYLFAPGDPESLSEQLMLAMQSPRETQACANEALRLVHKNFSSDRMVRETGEIYANVLGC